MEIFGWDRDMFKELQTDVTGYMLTEVMWSSRHEVRGAWWFLWCPRLKLLV